MPPKHILAAIPALFVSIAYAQSPEPIERVKITDNSLSCRQMFDEREAMDRAIVDAKAAQSSAQATATAGQAGGVATEVASRTGLFGSLGGLAGHLLGTVAGKTAANAAEQSGQQDAAAAAEREKQASARKEHLTQLFLTKGCSAADPPAPARTMSAATTPQLATASPKLTTVAPGVVSAAPSADILSGSRAGALAVNVNAINLEDLQDSEKTLVIPTAYVRLLVSGRVVASKQAGLFQRGSGSAHASVSYRVDGVDKAYAQLLAKAAQDNLVAQLRQAGYKVLTYDDVKDRDYVRNAQRETAQATVSENGNDFLVASPSDEQYFKSGFAGGFFAELQSGGKNRFTDATLIIPQYTFAAPQAWAEGSRGYNSVSAEANVVHGMNMIQASAHWMGQPKSRMMRGIPGVATREQVINASTEVGTLTKTADTTPAASNALSSALSGLTGSGNIQRSSSAYLLTVDREAYAAGVMNGVVSFNTEVARAAATKP
jgi:hypothetical protein